MNDRTGPNLTLLIVCSFAVLVMAGMVVLAALLLYWAAA